MEPRVTDVAFTTGVGEVAQEIKGRIEEFKPFIPLIQGLRNPGMRNRHWEQLSDDLGFPIRQKANLTFSKCLEMKLNDHIQTIAKVAEVAGKEYSIEQVSVRAGHYSKQVWSRTTWCKMNECECGVHYPLCRSYPFVPSVTRASCVTYVSVCCLLLGARQDGERMETNLF